MRGLLLVVLSVLVMAAYVESSRTMNRYQKRLGNYAAHDDFRGHRRGLRKRGFGEKFNKRSFLPYFPPFSIG